MADSQTNDPVATLILNELDTALIRSAHAVAEPEGGFALHVMLDGRMVSVDPRKILRAVVRGAELEGHRTGDLDSSDAERMYRGTLRGGKKSARDKNYGLNDKEFWKWWHRLGKAQTLGRDIKSKAEAEDEFEAYRRAKEFVSSSVIYRFIPNLDPRERRQASSLMHDLALIVARVQQ